ncbi:MAG: hypothetical protein K2Y22_10350 [Candidatus Obscuribacterales bacterium]|nr:hypothetical protein [Candidatus Obscuribacterales bacterium]
MIEFNLDLINQMQFPELRFAPGLQLSKQESKRRLEVQIAAGNNSRELCSASVRRLSIRTNLLMYAKLQIALSG